MPMPPVDKVDPKPPVLVFQSPREAAARAQVYRRRRSRERPRERLLRVVALAGTLLVHLAFLFGAVLGSAYDFESPSTRPAEALQVRLIDRPEPPPPPPVRGSVPRQAGPTHHGRAPTRRRRAVATRAAPARERPPAEVPRPDLPVVSVEVKPATIKLAPVAAPRPTVSLPHPQPSPEIEPVPAAGEPPQIVLDTPPAPRPVPPRFQPEPVRKPQLEGTRPMPPPPSLAMPELPAQALPEVSAPSIALDTRVPRPDAPVGLAAPLPPAAPAVAAEPALDSVPLSTLPGPEIRLQATPSVTAADVPRERTHVQVPTITLDQPQLAPIPSASPGPAAPPRPQAPQMDMAAVDTTPAVSRPMISSAALSVTPASERALPAPSASAALPAEASSVAPAPAETALAAEAKPAADEAAQAVAEDHSSAPEASPQGEDYVRPGQATGVAHPALPQATSAGVAATAGTAGNGPHAGEGEGKQGKAQPGADHGQPQGRLGSYTALKPRGNMQVMSHDVPDIGYRPTRFENDWAPEGESTLDTALRHAVEKTTLEHTFHLPRGVRVKCAVMPLFPMALLGCGNGDPPPKPVAEKVYDRMHLAPAQPLAPVSPATVSASPAPAIAPDNSAQCAAARVAGGPLPPDCAGVPGATLPSLQSPAPTPARSSSSWVPASDQFQ